MQNRPQPPRSNGETRRPIQPGGAQPTRSASYNANAPQRPAAPRQGVQPPRYAQSRPAAQQMRPRAAYPNAGGARPAQPRPAPRPAPARPAPHGNGITLYRPSILKPIALLAGAIWTRWRAISRPSNRPCAPAIP